MTQRLVSFLRQETGTALLMALGMLVVLSISSATVITLTSSNSRSAKRDDKTALARTFAEAGVNNALAVLNYWNDSTQQNNAADGTLLGCNSAGTSCTPRVTQFANGRAEWYGVFSISTTRWTIYSTGIVTNPAGGDLVRKTLNATVPVAWNNTQPANAAAWNYMYATRPAGAGCEVSVNGNNAIINFPIYIVGDLCLTNTNARVDEDGEGQSPAPQPIDIRIGGKVVFSGSGTSLGVSGDNITSAVVVGGCSSSISTAGTACTSSPWVNSKYFVDTTTTFNTIEEPTADFATHYGDANPGPNHDCATASNPTNLAPTIFDSNTTMDATTPTFNLTPTASGSSYQCQAYDSNGLLVGELSWSQTTNTLTVRGMIFIDGNVTTQSTTATYQGTASLYVNGTFTLNGNNVQLCANASCDFATWNPNNEMLMIIANGAGTAINFGGTQNKFEGAFFCNSNATIAFGGNNSVMEGPAVCGSMSFATGVTLKPLPAITQLPIGAPLNPNVHASPGKPYYG